MQLNANKVYTFYWLLLAGVSSMVVSFLVSVFYNVLLAWVLWYFFHSFQDPLPWSQCPINENLTGKIKYQAKHKKQTKH